MQAAPRSLTVVSDVVDEHARVQRRALRLEWATIAWNVVEVFVAIGLGIAAGSLALIAFGLDSVIEIWASVVVVWHVSRREQTRRRTARALGLVSLAFYALGLFLIVVSTERVISGARPDDSPIGIGYLAATVVVMFTLAHLKATVGAQLGDHPLASEARMTLLDGCLAFGILAALVARTALGWAWADALAAGVVGVLALLEGRENHIEARKLGASDIDGVGVDRIVAPPPRTEPRHGLPGSARGRPGSAPSTRDVTRRWR